MADEPRIAGPAPTAQLPRTDPPSRWRAVDDGPSRKPWQAISVVLLIAGCVLAPLGVAAAWGKNLVTNQDAYLETVGPLLTDPVILKAAENRIVTGIDAAITNLNLADKIGDELQSLGLPPRLSSLATSYLATFRTDITDAVTKLTDQVLRSPQLTTVWNEANAKAHTAFVTLLQGEPTRLSSINLDLSAAVSAVKQKLSGAGVEWASQIPDVPVVFKVTGNADVRQLSGYYDTLVTLGSWLPIVALVLLVLSILLAPSRLAGLAKAAGWLAFSMLALAVALIVGRGVADLAGHRAAGGHPGVHPRAHGEPSGHYPARRRRCGGALGAGLDVRAVPQRGRGAHGHAPAHQEWAGPVALGGTDRCRGDRRRAGRRASFFGTAQTPLGGVDHRGRRTGRRHRVRSASGIGAVNRCGDPRALREHPRVSRDRASARRTG